MDLLTISETATLLKVTPTTVRRYISTGRLPAVRVGRGVRVRKEALEDLLTPITPQHADTDPSYSQPTGSRMADIERAAIRPMTDAQAQQVLQAVEQARRAQQEQLTHRGGEPFSPSWEVLDEVRERRTHDLA